GLPGHRLALGDRCFTWNTSPGDGARREDVRGSEAQAAGGADDYGGDRHRAAAGDAAGGRPEANRRARRPVEWARPARPVGPPGPAPRRGGGIRGDVRGARRPHGEAPRARRARARRRALISSAADGARLDARVRMGAGAGEGRSRAPGRICTSLIGGYGGRGKKSSREIWTRARSLAP